MLTRYTNDSVSDMLTRLRNANMVKKQNVLIPKTRMTLNIAKILQEEGFIESYQEIQDPHSFNISLKYIGKDAKPALLNLKRISKPGCRVYVNSKKIPEILGGIGIALVSTSKGVLTGNSARNQKLGGELLCSIY